MKILWRSLVLSSALALALGAARDLSAQCSAPNDPPPGVCPLIAGPLRFDRCFGGLGTPAEPGKSVCNALRDSNKVAQDLGRDANKAVNDAKRDMQDLVKVTTEDAINKEAALKFVAARKEINDIVADGRALVNDPKCGTNGAIKGFQQAFANAAQNLTQAGEIAGKTVQAGSEAAKALPEITAALNEAQQLLADVQKAGAAAETERKKLEDALKRLQANLDALGKLDLTGAATAGGSLVSSVGPFLVNCGGCAAALYGAIGQAAASIGTAGAGTGACPESGGAGCVFGFSASAVTGAGAALTGAVASAPCSSAVEGVDKMGEYADKIKKFVDGSVKVAENLQKNVQDLQSAADALSQLASKLPAQLKPRVDKIAASIDRAGDDVNRGIDILQADVAPRVQKLTTQMVQQLGTQTKDMTVCWSRFTETAAMMGQDAGEAVTLLADASTNLVDGGKVVENIQKQGADAVQAAGAAAQRKWADLDTKYAALHRDLWGVPPGTTDLGRTIQNLPNLATKIGKIASDLSSYGDAVGKLVTGAVDAGKNAFLDRDRLKAQARPKFDTAEQKARAAVISIAKAKAKAEAKRNAAKQAPAVNVTLAALNSNIVKAKKLNVSGLQFAR